MRQVRRQVKVNGSSRRGEKNPQELEVVDGSPDTVYTSALFRPEK